jgi:hypothetical protein
MFYLYSEIQIPSDRFFVSRKMQTKQKNDRERMASKGGAADSPPKGGFDNLVPMALTPTRGSRNGSSNQELEPWDEYLESVLKRQESAKSIDVYRLLMLKSLEDNLDTQWALIADDVQTRWPDIFNRLEGVDYVHGFRALELGGGTDVNSEIGPVFHLVPFLNFSISSNFQSGRLFLNFTAALVLAIWISRNVCKIQNSEEGYFAFQALQSKTGDRFVTKFFNWFSQHVANTEKEFNQWCAKLSIPDSLLHLITNNLASESIISHLGTTGYNQFTLSEPLPLAKAQRIFDHLNGNHIMNTLKLKGGATKLYEEILFQIGAKPTTCQISDELVKRMGEDLLLYLPKSDPVERAKFRSVWGISILLTVSETKNSPIRSPYYEDDTAFYTYFARKSGKQVSAWFSGSLVTVKDVNGGANTTPPGTNSKSNNEGGEKRQRNE